MKTYLCYSNECLSYYFHPFVPLKKDVQHGLI
ncbi:hypothetical protein LINPERPRIM_LOCUS23239 [Linum perenne]